MTASPANKSTLLVMVDQGVPGRASCIAVSFVIKDSRLSLKDDCYDKPQYMRAIACIANPYR
jgi:hypothetical protein